MKNIVIAFLCGLLSVSVSSSQGLKKSDFRIGALVVNAKMDSTLLFREWGHPKNVDRNIETHRTFKPETSYVYSFDSLTVDVDRFGIRWFDFTSSILKTHRGVRVGDSAEKVRRLYGEPSPEMWLGWPEGEVEEVVSYFRDNSTLGIAFYLSKGRIFKIVVGWGST